MMSKTRYATTLGLALVTASLVCAGLPGAGHAQASKGDSSALACAAAYQVDWAATASPERSAADRAGAEKAYEAYRMQTGQASDTLNAAVRQKVTAIEALIGPNFEGLPQMVEICDTTWGAGASRFAAQYPAPSTSGPTNSGATTTFEAAESEASAAQDSEPSQSARCETTDRRASGIMNTWTYALRDYMDLGERDYDRERELDDLFRSLRSRLEDEAATAETYGCAQLASEIRDALDEWENPL